MLKKSLIFVTFLLIAIFTVTILAAELTAADKPGGKKSVSRINLGSVPKTGLSGAQNPVGRIPGDKTDATKSLGFDEPSSNSPGLTVGYTTYDNQSYSRMNRQVDWRAIEYVHFTWTKQTIAAPLGDCGTTYEVWDSDDAELMWRYHEYGGCDIHPRYGYGDIYSAYTGLDVDTEGKVIIANNYYQWDEGFATTVWYDFLAGSCFFGPYRRRIPDTTMQYGVSSEYIQSGEWRFLWPSMEYQVLDGDTVTHVFAYQNRNDDKSSFVHYFRRVGSDTVGAWDYPPMIVDTIPTISQIVTSSRTTGKVALVWQAPPGEVPGDPESLSRDWFDPGLGSNQRTNEVFYMISYDMGASWYEKHNVTVFDPSQGGWLGQGDMSALIASDDNLHIVWNAREVVPAPMGLGRFTHFYGGRLFHWDENTNEIRVIKDANWDLPDDSACHGGAWNEMSIVKPQISECDGKFYTIFVQFNDIDNGIYNDCHENAFTAHEESGTANGELYISVSHNGGYNWDIARNLTNSYTPGCDTSGIPYECDSDMWPSISRFGMEVTIGDFTGVPVVDPSGAYSGNYFLDVFYVNDKYPGSCLDNARVWTTNELKWFRVPCIEPEPNPVLSVTPREIGDPTWTKPGVEITKPGKLENIGNAPLTINTVTTINTDQSPADWLAVTPNLDGIVISHLSPNYYDFTLRLNAGGAVQTGPVAMEGYVVIQSNSVGGSTDSIHVKLIVADSLQFPETADIRTECTRMIFNNAGNIGNKGNYHVGNYNLDFFDDCDTSHNQMGEDDNASIYLYEASPFILRINGTGDTILNYYMYDADWLSDDGFRPTEGMYVDSTTYPDYQYTHTGWFLTKDSAVKLNCQYFAPKHPDSCKFIVQRLTVTNSHSSSIPGIHVGNIIDWDIPSDSGVRNGSDFDAAGGEGSRDLMYCYGGEYAPDSIENNDCVLADQRVAGMAFYNGYRIPFNLPADSLENPAGPWWTHINHDWIDPTGGFIPGQLYEKIESLGGGFEPWSSEDPDSIAEDLHMVAVFGQFDLGQTDTLVFVNILATEYDGSVPGIQQTVDKARVWIASRPEIFCWPEPIPLGRCCYGDSTSPDCDYLIVEECAALADALSWRGDLSCVPDACTPQIDSPVGHWKFDEGAGNLAHDSSGFGNTGTLINGPTWVDGIVGKALSFDGVNDYVEIPDAPALDIGGSFTITAWIYPRSFNQYYNFLVAKRDNYVLACENSGSRLSIGFTNTAGSGYLMHSVWGTLNLNRWQHIATTWDGHSLKLFKNGAEIKSLSFGPYHGFDLPPI